LPCGRARSLYRPEVESAIAEQAERGCGVVVSFEETDFVDSSVIRALFVGDRSLRLDGKRLVLHLGTPKIVERAVELSGVLESLPWSDSLAEAVTLAQETD
jgi:anti-anti-sigma regulatory factor